MNNPIVRIVLAILVGALLGYSIAVSPGLYQQWQDHRMLLEDMATNPAYRAIEEAESYNPRITVLNVIEIEAKSGSMVTMWALHDTAGIEEDEWQAYLVDTLAQLWQTLADNYPNKTSYAIVFAQLLTVPTIEGNKPQINGISVFLINKYALPKLIAEPTSETLDRLYVRGEFVFEWIARQSAILVDILPREPGYIWIWDDGVNCNSCN